MTSIWNHTFQFTKSSSILALWWGAWIISNIVDRVYSRMPQETFDESITATKFELYSSPLCIIAALAVMKIIKDITNKHEEIYTSEVV